MLGLNPDRSSESSNSPNTEFIEVNSSPPTALPPPISQPPKRPTFDLNRAKLKFNSFKIPQTLTSQLQSKVATAAAAAGKPKPDKTGSKKEKRKDSCGADESPSRFFSVMWCKISRKKVKNRSFVNMDIFRIFHYNISVFFLLFTAQEMGRRWYVNV